MSVGSRPGAESATGLPALPGRLLGPYRLVHKVGEGGMGVVHLAVAPDGQAVAVKVLRAHVAGDPNARERLAREVDTLQRVRHPRVAEVLDADVDCETPYLVTRYVPGAALDDVVRSGGPLSGADLVRLGQGLGEALAAIHAVGVVHRDLKPANVLILDGEPVVIDFGIAHVADDIRLTGTDLVMGTPGYLSPELVAGEPVEAATDWWGWAATMAFAATGRPPFGRGPLEVVLDRVRRGAADVTGAPDALVPVLTAALASEPARRPRPGALRRAVQRLRDEVEEQAGPTEAVIPPQKVVAHPDEVIGQPTEVIAHPTEVVHPAELAQPTEVIAQRTEVIPRHTEVVPAMPPPEPYDARPRPLGYSDPDAVDETGRFSDAHLPPDTELHGGEGSWVPESRSRRTGTLLAALVALMAATTVLPVVALATAVAASVLARTVDRTHSMLMRRRYERGPRRGDRPLAFLVSPWHLLVALAWSVPLLVLPVLVSASAVFLAGLLVDLSGSTVGQTVPFALAAAAGALTAWWGPGGSSLRRGSRAVVRASSPGPNGPSVAVPALLALAGGLVVLLMMWQWSPEWFPLDQPPLSNGDWLS